MTNLAAAVEELKELMRLSKSATQGYWNEDEGGDVVRDDGTTIFSRQASECGIPLDESFANTTLTVQAVNVIKIHGETILAELGRGAGEIVGHVHVDSLEEIISGKLSAVVIFKEPHEKTAPLFAHPPVAGLAELTDAQLVELFDYIEVARGNAAQKHWASSETMQSWEARRKVVIAKAAREFLGKVE